MLFYTLFWKYQTGRHAPDAANTSPELPFGKTLRRTHTHGTIFVDAAWAVFSALAWPVGEPRPELIEYPLVECSSTIVDVSQARIHKSWGPHNGLFIAIATNDPYHVVPITWMDTEAGVHTTVPIEHPAAAHIITTFNEEPLLQMTPLLFGYETICSSSLDPIAPVAALHNAIMLPDLPHDTHPQIAQHIKDVQWQSRHKGRHDKASTVAIIQVSNEHCECNSMEANMMSGWIDTLQPNSGCDPSARNAEFLVVWDLKLMEDAATSAINGAEVQQNSMGIIWATEFPQA